MDAAGLRKLLDPYNPWWRGDTTWRDALPPYRRPIVARILSDLRDLNQAISVTGPRRVGKSTAVRHVISHLLTEEKLDPARLLYFTLDDPGIFASKGLQGTIFDLLVEQFATTSETTYFFLDEIQRLPQWELYIKKYYDLKYPVRFIVSGSASSPIFRKSQESLLGRIKDRHLLPFSFREYCEYRLQKQPAFAQILHEERDLRPALLAGEGMAAAESLRRLDERIRPFQRDIDCAVIDYCREGGFPEVWELSDPVRKIEYLMEQQVRKVLFEDLAALVSYRKPENVLRFFVYLLANPGAEINITTVAREAGVTTTVVGDNLPRLEMTDLITRVPRFHYNPLRVRQGNMKCYPVDMALRNAVLKTWVVPDQQTMGLYAENLVIRELQTWPEAIEITYFRQKDLEVDFVVTHGGQRYLPIEVKLGAGTGIPRGLKAFMRKYRLDLGLVIGRDPEIRFDEVLYCPLRHFLLVS